MNRREVFKDPIHNWISLNVDSFRTIFKKEEDRKEIAKCIQNLIATKEFSRLIDIKQLGFVEQIFPGASHNRFSHSLGVFHLAKTILANNKTIKWSEEEALLLLFGALLHDVGHGFYSHTFEVFTNNNTYSHEKMTAKIISDESLGVYKCFQNSKYKKLKSIPSKLSDFFLNETKESFKKVKAFLSSQLDVDRLDYLMRDSYHSGVSYKFGEAEFLLKYAKWDEDKGIVYFDEVLQSTIIHYLLTRFQMHKAVYMHRDSLFKDAIMHFIGCQIRLRQDCSMFNIASIPNEVDPIEFINYTDSWATQEFKVMEEELKGESILSSLIKMFFSISLSNYSIYSKKEILEIESVQEFLKSKKKKLTSSCSFKTNNKTHFIFKIQNIDWYNDKQPLYIKKEGGVIVKLEKNIVNTSHLHRKEDFLYWEIDNKSI